MMKMFGSIDGRDVHEIFLKNGDMSCSVLTYGCVLRTLVVPGRNGPVDVVLGYDSLEQYRTLSGRLGAVIGRYANRISEGRFVLNGREHRLTLNRGIDHIHGGASGFDRKIWNIDSVTDSSVSLSYDSPDGEEGYPGNMHVKVTYDLQQSGLVIEYEMTSDSDTVFSLTNHSYFNLGGEGTVSDHTVSVNADRYTPLNERSIPTGGISDVSGKMDLRMPKELSDVTENGYDDNYLLNGGGPCARCHCGRTGVTMEVATDMPAMQFYTGNGLKDGIVSKGGRILTKCAGLCFETQNCPDAPNHPNFPSSVLKAGEIKVSRTVYSFSCE